MTSNKSPRKVFIATLGIGVYNPVFYTKDKTFQSKETKFIQIATMEYLGVHEWTADDLVLICLTEESKIKNWESGYIDTWQDKPQSRGIGLKESIQNLGLCCEVKAIDIPLGKNEQEIWEIFHLILDSICKNDSIYIDVTHGFRYLPMLTLVLANYTKYLKNATVESITYGCYELTENKLAPIIDVTPLSTLQDWASAANSFISSGNAEMLNQLSNKQQNKIEKKDRTNYHNAMSSFVKGVYNITQNIHKARGIRLYDAESFKSVQEAYQIFTDEEHSPYMPIYEMIYNTLSQFSIKRNELNGFLAAKWAFNHQLPSQGFVLLQETFVSWVLNILGVPLMATGNELDYRFLVGGVCDSMSQKIKYETYVQKIASDNKEIADVVEKMYHLEVLITFGARIGLLKQARNDIAHAGWNDSPMKNTTFENKIKEAQLLIEDMIAYLELKPTNRQVPNRPPLLLNLSNHPYEMWSNKQKKAAKKPYEKVEDIAFPNINPSINEKEIEALVNQYCDIIISYSKDYKVTVHVMGELTFTFALVSKLKALGIPAIASTTERNSVEETGVKSSVFEFVKFRHYK